MAEQLLGKEGGFTSGDIAEVASQFKEGMDTIAIANQYLYSTRMEAEELKINEWLDRVLDGIDTLSSDEKNLIRLYAKAVILRDENARSNLPTEITRLYKDVPEFKEKYPDAKLFGSLILPIKEIQQKGSKKIISDYKQIEGGGEVVKWLIPILKSRAAEIDKNWGHVSEHKI